MTALDDMGRILKPSGPIHLAASSFRRHILREARPSPCFSLERVPLPSLIKSIQLMAIRPHALCDSGPAVRLAGLTAGVSLVVRSRAASGCIVAKAFAADRTCCAVTSLGMRAHIESVEVAGHVQLPAAAGLRSAFLADPKLLCLALAW